MRFILDNNIAISAFLFFHSVPSLALTNAKSKGTIINSESIFIELVDTLIRPKFDKYVSLNSRTDFISEYKSLCKFIEVKFNVSACRDPKDNKYLELALSGKADCIITGDNDLLVLNPFEGIPIITPRNFIDKH